MAHIHVVPLSLSEKDLTADRMLALMGCDNLEVRLGVVGLATLFLTDHFTRDHAAIHAYRATYHPHHGCRYLQLLKSVLKLLRRVEEPIPLHRIQTPDWS
jgi:hypothetical protein